ncbi:MAG TPA: helix-turn-helix domain-containing protein [Amycolatopsis sp.]|nr:helix-turn-helix domain-containing protein [Amycolatopsis sp.]
MALPSTYADSNCSLARALEIVGERWTLLIVRDAFYGVRRFGDFATQLGIPRAVLTARLKLLVREGVLSREETGGAVDYVLTDKGVALWPIVRSLITWGDDFYSPAGARRTMTHATDDAPLTADGHCTRCGTLVAVPDICMAPGPGYVSTGEDLDPVSAALTAPRRLLSPLTPARGES